SMACGWSMPWAMAPHEEKPVGVYAEMGKVKGGAEHPDPDAKKDEDGYYVWSEERVNEALQAGHPVFIDFGAAWCLTCQVNEQGLLNSDKVEELFKRHGAVFFKADWTGRNPEITEALAGFGRSGVPLYVCIMPQNPHKPIILPELLTYDDLEEAFEPVREEVKR
ncbi:thioredoxin family protein, partial [bacterium]|nr:thioredoxin family protein [bacterium]